MTVERSAELEAITRRLLAAMAASDVDALQGMCEFGPDNWWIGTDPNEVWSGPEIVELVRRQQEQMATRLEPGEIKAWEYGPAGWAMYLGAFITPDGRIPVRATAVFRLVAGQWKITHTHASIGASNQETFGIELVTSLDNVAHAVEVERPDLGAVTAPDGTVTLLFTDIEGSTERNQDVGDREWMAVLREHHDVVREQIAAHQGFEVKSMGDGFMVAFASARWAVRCAADIQRAIAKEDLAIRVRAGLHAGEAVRVGDDFYGATVNMAARVAGAAQGGEVLVSSLVRALIESSGEFAFGTTRQAELKGIPGSHDLHPVAVER